MGSPGCSIPMAWMTAMRSAAIFSMQWTTEGVKAYLNREYRSPLWSISAADSTVLAMWLMTLPARMVPSKTFRLAVYSTTPSSALSTFSVSEDALSQSLPFRLRGMPTVTSAGAVRRQGAEVALLFRQGHLCGDAQLPDTSRKRKDPRLPGMMRMCWPSSRWGAMARATSSWRSAGTWTKMAWAPRTASAGSVVTLAGAPKPGSCPAAGYTPAPSPRSARRQSAHGRKA